MYVIPFCLLVSCSRADVIDWLQVHGGTVHGLHITEFHGMGRGVRCLSRLEPGAKAVFTPSPVILSGLSGNKAARTYGEVQTLKDSDAIVFQLLLETAKGMSSQWASYLAVLPSRVITPKAFRRVARTALQDLRVMDRAARTREHDAMAMISIEPVLRRAVHMGCSVMSVKKPLGHSAHPPVAVAM